MDTINTTKDNEENGLSSDALRRFTLRKAEKLRHKKLVGTLFSEGKSIYEFPVRLVWRALSPEELEASFRAGIPEKSGKLQMLITIPKKKRRRAVDRVLLRRRLREAYRLNRLPLAEAINGRPDIGAVTLAFIFLGKENTPYSILERKMKALLDRLEKKLWKIDFTPPKDRKETERNGNQSAESGKEDAR